MGLIGKGFYHYGRWAAERPLTAIFLGLCIISIGAVGFINIQTTVSSSYSADALTPIG